MQKKGIKIEMSLKTELESEIAKASQVFQDMNKQVSDLKKLLSLMTTSYGKGSDLYTTIFEKSKLFESKFKELGIPNDPIIDKAKKLAQSLKEIGEKQIKPYLFK